MRGPSRRHIWASTAVLLIAALAVFSRADDLSMWFDELWSMFQNARPLSHILRERELNWPVGYAVTLHAWTSLISAHDFVVHMLGALIGLLGAAFMIQAGRALHSDRAGWLAGLAFGTSGYVVYFFLEARGYGMQLMLLAALVAFMVRWVRRPTWARAVPYALAQILLLYTHFSSGLAIALSAVYVLLVLPRPLWWRWGVVMAVTGLAFLPAAAQFRESYRLRSKALREGPLPSYFLKGPESLYRAYSVHQDVVWGVLLALAVVGLAVWVARRGQRAWAAVLWLAAWGLAVPAYAYVTRETTGLFTTRYLSFTAPAVLLLVGLGLAALPRRGWMAGGALLLIFALFPWQPFDHRPKYSDEPPVRDLMREMVDRFQTGDVLAIDPSIDDTDFAWWYYEPLYIPGGRLARAEDGETGARRVWYLARQGSADLDLQASVAQGRIMTEFWGPWYFIATLYEGPPLTAGVRVGEALRYSGHVLPGGMRHMPGDRLPVQTWWRVDEPLNADYSLGLHLLDPDGNLIAQNDSGPVGPYTPPQSSSWLPGEVYRDDRTLVIPWCLAPGAYQLALVVYQSWDQTRLAPAPSPWTGPENRLILDTITIDTFSYCKRGR